MALSIEQMKAQEVAALPQRDMMTGGGSGGGSLTAFVGVSLFLGSFYCPYKG